MKKIVMSLVVMASVNSFAAGASVVDNLLEDARNLRVLMYSGLVMSQDRVHGVVYEIPNKKIDITTESLSRFQDSTQKRVQFLFLSAGKSSNKTTEQYTRETVRVDDNTEYNINLKRFSELNAAYIGVLAQIAAVAPINLEFVHLVSNDSRVIIKVDDATNTIVSKITAQSLLRNSGRVVCKSDDLSSDACSKYDGYIPHAESYGLYFSNPVRGKDGFDQVYF